MGETDLGSSNVGYDIIRRLLSTLDRPAYWLLGLCYELFFNVASADLFSNQTIMKFYGRVQIILGVFMMFQLSMTILKGIVNPDTFTGDKGAKAVITRIFTSLILLTVLMPISIPNPKNEYEIQINNNGLLFGTLYSLQRRILSNNTIGRLVLGTADTDSGFKASSSYDDNNLKKSARIFTSTIIKGFYRINLIPVEERDDTYLKEGKDPATYNDNRVCTDIPDDVLDRYTRIDADPGDIIGMVNETCTVDFNIMNYIPVISAFAGSKKYVFTYMPIVSMIVALIFVFVLLSFTIDVAVRAVKLAVLRLIAPIPIISYMDPKGGNDGAFNSWVKALSSTYLDLFIRLAVVYFVIFLIQDMIVHGVIMDVGDGVIGILSMIIIWIGLFIFAKQAPKFIKQVLGMKDDAGGKLFGGLGEIAAIGAVGAGVVGGAVSKGFGTYAANEGKEHNMAKSIVAGITGGVSGGRAAGKTFLSQTKGADASAIMNQVRANNARNYSQTADDSTFTGRFAAGLQANLGMKNQMQKYDDKIKYYGLAESSMARINKAFDSNGDAKVRFTGATIQDSRGNDVLVSGNDYSLKDYNDILTRVNASGDNTLIAAVTKAKKDAEQVRFDQIRTLSREQVEANIQNEVAGWSSNDLVVHESLETIFSVGNKYADQAEFSRIGSHKMGDAGLNWGKDVKHDAGQAGKTADMIKNSAGYSTAKANAERAKDSKK